MAAITGLTVVYGEYASPPEGYVIIKKDLNRNAGGEFVYLCYSTSKNLGSPITAIQVAASDYQRDPSATPNDFTLISHDLNKGARGKYIYASYATGTSAGPITAVDVMYGEMRNVWPPKEWIRVNQDCNEGARGDFIYIIYKH